MAVTEVHCLNCDNEFELAGCGFAFIYLCMKRMFQTNSKIRL